MKISGVHMKNLSDGEFDGFQWFPGLESSAYETQRSKELRTYMRVNVVRVDVMRSMGFFFSFNMFDGEVRKCWKRKTARENSDRERMNKVYFQEVKNWAHRSV